MNLCKLILISVNVGYMILCMNILMSGNGFEFLNVGLSINFERYNEISKKLE